MNMHVQPAARFRGSYHPGDIEFLLKQVDIRPTAVGEKEALIQSGQRHYSEMISDEARPDERYLTIFRDAWKANRDRIAQEVLAIAEAIRADMAAGRLPAQVTLCSLVRAGAPLGVLLLRALGDMRIDVRHYGISIIRDRGLDRNAMDVIMAERDPEGILFIDGWTGKGAIRGELDRSWREIAGRRPRLVVLADPCGLADIAGSDEDWLIPSGILGANISGLISRTILNEDVIGPDDFHGFIPVDHLADIDFSVSFVNDIHARMRELGSSAKTAVRIEDPNCRALMLNERSGATVANLMKGFGTDNPNRIKPGIAEATRAVLRRKPHFVLISNRHDPDLQALIHLCVTNGVTLVADPTLTGPYRAITIIEKAG